ncbi:MAG: hypothetical protein COT74_01280 [Bdellovibrionales bacterium CG10_big_fil_rev_8_21_14_0_10_45_34]|nr:MAG: hypothetical protein COT74_01280 [Bdellovibrionales bacterium CG10_big_fil_rev_8_21_14_0_10_45_34]
MLTTVLSKLDNRRMRRVLLVIEDFSEAMYLETLLKKLGFDCLAVRNELGLSTQILQLSPHLIIATYNGRKVKGFSLGSRIRRNAAGEPGLILLRKGNEPQVPTSGQVDGLLNSPVNARELIAMVCSVCSINIMQLIEKIKRVQTSGGGLGQAPIHVSGKSRESERIAVSGNRFAQAQVKLRGQDQDTSNNHASEAGSKSEPASSQSLGEGGDFDEARNQFEDLLGILESMSPTVEKNSDFRRQAKWSHENAPVNYDRFLESMPPARSNGIDGKLAKLEVEEFRGLENREEIKEVDDERKEFVRALFKK